MLTQHEHDRLTAAKAGDSRAFDDLTRPFMRELHLHCYRMLGSLADADDARQETLLRAWRRIDRFEPRAPLRAWLYRIATNVCLTMLARHARRDEVMASDREKGEPVHLDPYPDYLLDEHLSVVPGPEAIIEQRESIELAFVAAVQMLPPRQRAILLLRDVIGYSAAEVATSLTTSVAAVNSALQRARATLEHERLVGRVTRSHAQTSTATEQALVRRLATAWHAADIPSIIALLTEDALLTMPPQSARYMGRAEIAAFLAVGPYGDRRMQYRLMPTRANGQPAVALYCRDSDAGSYRAHAVMVIAIAGDAIASLVRFADPDLFPRFGLPAALDGDEREEWAG